MSGIKQESVIEVQTPNLVMEPVTCSLDIRNDLDDFARYIENQCFNRVCAKESFGMHFTCRWSLKISF